MPVQDGARTVREAGAGYGASWESLRGHRTPEWFRDAKFGIWAHWGPQSVPRMGDWYARHLYGPYAGSEDWERERAARFTAAHRTRYGHPSQVGHKDICHMWRAEHWDPEALIEEYRNAGARYFMSMGAHCDNFDLWDSAHQPWNATRVGPGTNVVGRWEAAARAAGLRFGVSAHFGSWTWRWLDAAFGADSGGPMRGVPYDGHLTAADGAGTWWEGLDPARLYGPVRRPGDRPTSAFVADFYGRMRDLVRQHRPDIIYFDDARMPFTAGSVCPATPAVLGRTDPGLDFLAWYYNQAAGWGRPDSAGIATIKRVPEPDRQAVMLDVERGAVDRAHADPWQNCTCLGEWFYKDGLALKTAAQVVQLLADVVSKNGNLLLSVPQRPDGTIDEEERATLGAIGRWLGDNGEAIYGTRPWAVCGEGPGGPRPGQEREEAYRYTAADIRFTTRGDRLYAILLGWPADRQAVITTLGKRAGAHAFEPSRVELLGVGGALPWDRDDRGLRVRLPDVAPGQPAYCLRISR